MRWRYVLWLTIPGVLLLVTMLTNPHVTNQYHVQRVQPFMLMSLAKIILIAILVVQHPGPAPGVSRWRIWRWVDPLTIGLIAMLIASAAYYVMLWGGNSQQFRAPDAGYDIARQLLWLDGWLLSSMGLEVLYRGVRSRIDNRTRRSVERYDVVDGEAPKKGDSADG